MALQSNVPNMSYVYTDTNNADKELLMTLQLLKSNVPNTSYVYAGPIIMLIWLNIKMYNGYHLLFSVQSTPP